MSLTLGQQIAQVNDHLGFPPEEELNEKAIERLRGPRFLDLYGKPIPTPDTDEVRDEDSHQIAERANRTRTFPEAWSKSPNFSKSGFDPKGGIFHFTGYSLESAINWLTQAKSKASYHAIADLKGRRTRLVDDRHRAWHAGGKNGSSKINGVNPNGVCLGFAFTGNLYTGAHRDGLLELTEEEIESAVEFFGLRWDTMKLDLDWFSDHRTVDPTRRNDIPPRELQRLMDRFRAEFS